MSEEICYIRLIPKIKIEYNRDYKQERGRLRIYFKKGWWEINYEYKDLTYSLNSGLLRTLDIELDITDKALRIIWEEDEKTGKFYKKEIPDWLIRNHGTEFKVITHSIHEIEIAEKLIEPKLIKRVFPSYIKELEFYRNNKILKIPFFKDEIRINIENENLEYIRDDKKLIKIISIK